MFRFVAMVWNPQLPDECAQAAELANKIGCAYGVSGGGLKLAGLHVLWADSRRGENMAYEVASGGGVVVGKVFRTGSESQLVSSPFDGSTSSAIVESAGRHLISTYWGRYVAFVKDAGSGDIHVLRDPSGTLPCFFLSLNGVKVFFSYIEDCIGLGFSFKPNWDHVAAHVVSAVNERLGVSALDGVEHVHPGECVTVAGGSVSRQFYWDPYRVASTNVIEDVAIASEMMRTTVDACVRAWASAYSGNILLRLSGGLDSSVVASCLGGHYPTATCFTHHSPGSASDERRYAREVAELAALDLIEYQRSDDVRLDRILDLVRHPVPFYARYSVEYSHVEAAIARDCGAAAIFSGEWGDLLFYVSTDMQSAIDAAWRHGISSTLFGATLDAARREGHLYWKVLATAVMDGMVRRRARDPWPPILDRQRPLVSDELRLWAARGHPYKHPWRDPRPGTPAGKYMHIYQSNLHDYQPFYDPTGFPSDPDQVAPLNSQPLIELCLRIPTYLHNQGGWERSILRRAFLDKASRSVITRRTKGTAEDHLKAVVAHNIDFVRSMLLDGELVGRGLIDRKRLEEVLSGEPTTIATALPELAWYQFNEVWAGRWR